MIARLTTKNATIHAVGRASSQPQSRVRWAERAGAASRVSSGTAISARLHLGPHRGTALDLVGVEEPEDVLVLQVGDLDVAGRHLLGQLREGREGVPDREGVV